jgi:Tol biopolymer transport system component
VRGEVTDHRSDIFSFGAILHEMICGRRAFRRDTLVETMTAILKEEPEELSASNPNLNPSLERIVRRCLEKKPERRFQSTADLGFALEALSAGSSSGGNRTATALELDLPPTVKMNRWRDRSWMLASAAIAIVALMLGAALIVNLRRPTSSTTPLRRFALAIPSKAAPNWNDFRVAISPDGARIAYNCREGNAVSLCVRALDSLTPRRVSESNEAQDWFFSPDGEWIGIADEVGLSKVSIRGGQPQTIHRWLDNERFPNGCSWGPDNFILFGTSSGIQRVSASGGAAERVTRIAPDAGVSGHGWPSYLPDGQSALFTIVRNDGSQTAGIVDLKNGSVRDLGIRGFGFVYVAPGWLAFGQGTTVLVQAFDPANPGRSNNPVPVLENVGNSFEVARDGTIVYVPTRGESTARLVWADRDGRPTAVAGERLDYTHLDLGPDGRRALLNIHGEVDLIDLQGGTRKLVARGSFPIWSADGERVTFAGAGGIQSAPVDGSAQPELLVPHPGFVVPTSWNAQTGELAYYDHRAFEIWIRSPDGKTRRFLGAPGRKRSGRFSPDGKWMAFVSDETGDYQVYVTAYPGPGPTVAVSTKGGLSPIWSADGHELYFRLGSKVLAARMSSAAPLAFSAPVELFDGPYTLDLMGHQREDVSADGRFLMVENSDDFPIVIVQNWPLELARLVK